MGYKTEGWRDIKVGSKVKILNGVGEVFGHIGEVLRVDEVQTTGATYLFASLVDLSGKYIGVVYVGEDRCDQVELIYEDNVEAPTEAIEEESDSPISEHTKPANLPLSAAQLILSQSGDYNGHMQLELSEMKLSDAKQLVIDLNNLTSAQGLDKCFVLQLETPSEWLGDHWSASVYELDGISSGKNKLWLGIDKILEG